MPRLLLPIFLVCTVGLFSGCVYDEEYGDDYGRRPAYYGSGYVRRAVVYEDHPYYYDNRSRYDDHGRSSHYRHDHHGRSDRDRDDHDDRRKSDDPDKDRKKENYRSSSSRGRVVEGKHYRERTYVKDDRKKDDDRKDEKRKKD